MNLLGYAGEGVTQRTPSPQPDLAVANDNRWVVDGGWGLLSPDILVDIHITESTSC